MAQEPKCTKCKGDENLGIYFRDQAEKQYSNGRPFLLCEKCGDGFKDTMTRKADFSSVAK